MTARTGAHDDDMRSASRGRWWQLFVGVLCMSMIANLQYGWTLFVNPISAKHGWGRAAIQVAFTLFVLTETWLVPIEGYLVDRFGPRIIVVLSSLLVGAAWVMNSFASSLPMLYVAAVVGGIGAGAVYGTCVGNALKWFPDRRGLAAGLTSMGFGAGSALTIVPIASTIKTHGYEYAFLVFGLGQGITVFLAGWFLKQPPVGFGRISSPGKVRRAAVPDRSPVEMARSPVFWIMYIMFVLMASGGLMATAQLAPIANDFKVADVPVSVLGLTLPALTFALSIDRILNGITRPVCGWISDRIGRENTMFFAFALEGFGILLLGSLGADPVAFVLLSALVFFAWGEIYSLFPATCADTFGSRYASANAGLLYTAKGTAALLVPLTSVLAASGGGWRTVFLAASVSNFIAAAMALFVLKPLRARMRATTAVGVPPSPVVVGAPAAPAAARAGAKEAP
jgi:OFA family oxalate/formate antiporter-like MFS transporter